jgi:hypothetical protein
MSTYWVIAVRRNGVETSPLGKLYATPFQADTFRQNMAISYLNYEYFVRPATWQEREARMFENDVYEHPVWANEPWWQRAVGHFRQMYVHISHLDPTAIAFTEDERKGEADRQTMMRPGKFLQKFLGAGPQGLIEHGPLAGQSPAISKMQIAFYADWHQRGSRPPSDDVLTITEDEDEIVRVYEDGPPSCMVGKSDWYVEDHPVRVYAGGGLAVAYLTSVSGEVIARALCWPKNEVFGRVYPTPRNDETTAQYDEMMSRLKAKGWVSITEDNTVFEGAWLQQRTNRWGRYIMPYLDNEYGVRDGPYRDGKSWWVMTHSENHQDNQDGVLANTEPDWTCENCEEGYSDEDDNYTVYRYWRGTSAYGSPRGDMTWCEGCRDQSTFYCEGCDEYFEDSTDSVYVDGCTYERNWFNANGGWACSHSGDHFFREDDPPVVLADGSLIHADSLEDAAFQCFVTQLWWPLHDQSRGVPGYHIDFDWHDPHPVEWACVVPVMPDDPLDVAAWAAAHANYPGVIAPVAPPVDPIIERVYGQLRGGIISHPPVTHPILNASLIS